MHWQIIVCCFLVCFACTEQRSGLSEEDAAKLKDIETLQDVRLTYSDSGKVRAKVFGPVLLRKIIQNDPLNEFPNGIKVEFFEEDGSLSSVLTADYAIRNDRDKKTTVQKNVILFNINGDTLKTSELIWEEITQKVYTDKYVKISRSGGNQLYGYGLVTDQSFRTGKAKSIEASFPATKFESPASE